MGVCIVGWAHTRFGRRDELDLEGLIDSVSRQAIEHAGIPAADIDATWLGNLNGGFVPDNFCSSFVLNADPALRWKPATRVENACASGSAAVFSACDAIEAGRARMALVVGAEKMTAVSGEEVTRVLANASYVKEEASKGMTFPGIFGQIARQYFTRFGDHSATLARIAAKNHRNGVSNPWAQVRKDLGFEFCNTVSEKNPFIAEPLRKTDCSLVSDGAAALVLADEQTGRALSRAIRFRARAQVNDILPMSRRDASAFEGPRRAWARALDAARCKIFDLSLAEVHDCFTIAELLAYEAMGLADRGTGARVLDEGIVYPGGRLPINVSGGLKAKGHPIGATGVSMHALAAMQLTGQAGEMQVPNARLAGVFNMGGAAVANYVSILEPLK
jgi:acetyl-CoA C-acetyltransferase